MNFLFWGAFFRPTVFSEAFAVSFEGVFQFSSCFHDVLPGHNRTHLMGGMRIQSDQPSFFGLQPNHGNLLSSLELTARLPLKIVGNWSR